MLVSEWLRSSWMVGLVTMGCGGAPAGSTPQAPSGTASTSARPASLTATQLWQVNPSVYLGDDLDDRALSRELVLLHRGPTALRIDPAKGVVSWERGGSDYFVHPPGKDTPMFAASYTGDRKALEVVDAATGKPRGTLALDSEIKSEIRELFWAGDSLIAFSWFWTDASRAIDPATGRKRFSIAPPKRNNTTYEVIVRDTAVIMVGLEHRAADNDVWAFDPRTGRQLFRTTSSAAASRPTVLASQDVAHIYVQKTPDRAVWIDASGAERGTVEGRVLAVSDDYVAVVRDDQLRVLRHGDPTSLVSVRKPADRTVHSVAIDGDSLVYTSASDDAFMWVDIKSGKEQRVMDAGSELVISPDASGTISTAVQAASLRGDRLYAVTGTKLTAWKVAISR